MNITRQHIEQMVHVIFSEFKQGFEQRTIDTPPGYQGMALKGAILAADAGIIARNLANVVPEGALAKIEAILYEEGGEDNESQPPAGEGQ